MGNEKFPQPITNLPGERWDRWMWHSYFGDVRIIRRTYFICNDGRLVTTTTTTRLRNAHHWNLKKYVLFQNILCRASGTPSHCPVPEMTVCKHAIHRGSCFSPTPIQAGLFFNLPDVGECMASRRLFIRGFVSARSNQRGSGGT